MSSDAREIAKRLAEFVEKHDAANPFRSADMHTDNCMCGRCLRDWVAAAVRKLEAANEQ